MHPSINGNIKMSCRLESFPFIAKENFQAYVNQHLDGKDDLKIHPVFATENEDIEYAKIENKTISEIQIITFNLIKLMNTVDQRKYNEYYKKCVKSKSKSVYVEFHNMVQEEYTTNYDIPENITI